jgi:2-oxoglutarate dehydrogenase E2 component (dihydrolipoamide succinyltransferase)
MLRSLLSRQRALGPCLSAAASAAPAAAVPAAAGGSGSGWWGLAAAAVSARLHTAGAPLLASLQVKIPALGESISDGTVSAVLKQAGDRVEEDEPILQIETDKVTVDVRAPRAGVIEAILVGAWVVGLGGGG